MTAVSTSRTAQTHTGVAAALMVSLGTNFSILSASTANVWPCHISQQEDSQTSTAQRATPRQIARSSTPETQPPEWREEIPWQARLVAGLEAQQLVNEALEELQTEEMLELFEVRSSEFIDQNGVAGIAAFETYLLRSTNPVTEPLIRRFLRALGSVRTPAVDTVARQVLLSQLSSLSGGRRSAAASALGAFPSLATLVALEQRAAVENNRIVLATLQAHIRVFRANGLSSTQAA